MADIKTTKINSIHTKVDANADILMELSEHFKYRMSDYQFTPQGRKGWNGWVHLYNRRSKYLPSGLLRYLFDFAREHGYTIAYDPDLLVTNAFSLEEAQAYINSLQISSRGASLEARDYQVMAFAKAIRYKRLTMISPTSSGKSLIAYCIVRYLLQYGACKRGLMVVPNTSLVEQMFGDFKDYSTHNEWYVDGLVQRIYDFAGSTTEVSDQTQLVISTWQSIYELGEEWFKQFDFVIGDEAHTFSAKCVGEVAKKLTRADYRIAMTGTTHGIEVQNLKMEGLFGPITKVTTTKKLMDAGHIAELSIKSLVFRHPIGTALKVKQSGGGTAQGAFSAEIDHIVTYEPRNRFIRNLALSIPGNTLLLFQFVERHGQVLFELIQERAKSRKVFFIHGGTETEQREQIRAITEGETDAILVASFGVFSTGVNIRNLHNVIFASPTASKIRTLQSIGRGLRLGDNKRTATLYDLADDFRESPDDKPNYTLKQYARRNILYIQEKFKVSHYTIDLKDKI